jgi:dTDP-D-glucose 4,6-dehydratase
VLGERYNIGTNVDRTVLDVVQTIAKHLDVPKVRQGEGGGYCCLLVLCCVCVVCVCAAW